MRIVSWKLGVRSSNTRIPFRYGRACLTECPQALLQVQFETDGQSVEGYAADCLPPLWFDKDATRDYEQQIGDMVAVISTASEAVRDEGEFGNALQALAIAEKADFDMQRPALLHAFGVSMIERAIVDAYCRVVGRPFRELLSSGFLYEGQSVRLEGVSTMVDVVPWEKDLTSSEMFVRHTVGMGDPLSTADIQVDDCLNDGRPQSLEQYIVESGIRYFKIKIGNRGREDLDRIRAVQEILQANNVESYQLTIDGNEQYSSFEEFGEFWYAFERDESLQPIYNAVIGIEQPINRSQAFESAALQGLEQIAKQTPVIIDESDATRETCLRALECGYSGTSSKACKGITKALLNRQLIQEYRRKGDRPYLMTAEDLCCVGVVALQTDLALVSAMGLRHVERNGHHYHPGLAYLEEDSYQAVLAAHGDLYEVVKGVPSVKVVDGIISLRTVNENGFGWKVDPRFESYQVVNASS